MTKISFKDVCKSFGDLVVLKDFTLDLKKGESLVIIGGSGTGKSVSLKCLLGLLTPDSGKIIVSGKNAVGANEKLKQDINENIGMLFQNGALFDSMTVEKNISFGLIASNRVRKKNTTAIVYDCLKKVGLGQHVANKYPSDLSGGMRKRVGIARAIATNPEIILFDEPTTGLDPITATTIDELILSTVKDLGVTAITITHDITSVRRIADRVAFLYEGKIVWSGTVKEMDKTNDPYIKQFINGKSQGPIKWGTVE